MSNLYGVARRKIHATAIRLNEPSRKPKAGEWSYVRKVGSVKIEVMESDREKSGRDDRCANKQIKNPLLPAQPD